jgi:hypothetical protein
LALAPAAAAPTQGLWPGPLLPPMPVSEDSAPKVTLLAVRAAKSAVLPTAP